MPDFICLDDNEVLAIPLLGDERISYGVAWNKKITNKVVTDFINITKDIYSR